MSIRTAIALAIVLASSAAHGDDVADGVKALTGASARHDAAAMSSLFDGSVYYGGLWFADAACASNFDRPRIVVGRGLETLARCIAKLDLQPSPRKAAVADAAIVVAKPGIEIVVAFANQRIARIGFVAPGVTPTISPAALELQRISGTRKLVTKRTGSVWMAVCIDARGDVSQSAPLDAATGGLDFDASKAIAGWKFRPFKLAGKVVAVSALVRFGDDKAVEVLPVQTSNRCEATGDENGEEGGVEGGVIGGMDMPPPPPPPPPMPPQNVAPTMLEGQRIAGNKNIVPDDDTKRQILASGKDTVVGSFKLCVDTSGVVTSVNPLKTTGFADYDAKIQREIRAWKYRPFVVNGRAVPVCTAVTFIYKQVAAPSGPPAKP